MPTSSVTRAPRGCPGPLTYDFCGILDKDMSPAKRTSPTQPSTSAVASPEREGGGVEPHDVDAEVVAGAEPPSKRRRLDRERIVAAGLDYIDEHDVAALTMRRLGTVLGVEAMALYRYVPSKEDLLDAIVDRMVAQMRADPGMLDSPTHGWQDFLQRLAHGIRRVSLAHPRAFPLLVARPPEAPWLRPPLRNVEWVEGFLAGLIEEGFDDDAAVDAYQAFTNFLLGHLLLEVATYGADIGPLDTLQDNQAIGLDDFPTLDRLQERLSTNRSAQHFEEALEDLLDRLSSRPAGSPPQQ